MIVASRLCWFCGNAAHINNTYLGMSPRAVIHNHTSITTPPKDSPTSVNSNDVQGAVESASICEACIRKVRSSFGSLEADYVRRHQEALDAFSTEMCDVDMDMLDVASMRYSFGCWFGWYPRLAISREFRSLTIGDLIQRGWRLQSPFYVSAPIVEFWCRRAEAVTREAEIPESYNYLREVIVVDGQQAPEFFVSLVSQLRASIFDITVARICDDRATPDV